MTVRRAAVAVALSVVLFGIYAAQRAPSLSWRHNGADGGDLARAAALLSVPHPTGYPTFLLVSQPFLQLPGGEPAGRLSLLSAFWTAAALGTLVLVRGADESSPALAGTALGAALLGFAPQIWSQALIVEVHGLQLFLAVLLIGAVVRRVRGGGKRALWLSLLVAGLALGNHLTTLLLLPMLALLWRTDSRRSLAAGIAVALPVTTMLYLGLALTSRFGTASPWGDLTTPQALWEHVSGRIYRDYVFGVPWDELTRRLTALPRLLVSELSLPGAILAMMGAARQWRRERAIAAAFALTFAVSAVFAAGYATADSRAYLLPALVCAAWWISEGAEAAVAWISSQGGTRRGAAVTSAAACVVLMGAPIVWRTLPMDVSHDDTVKAFGAAVWDATSPGAIVITESDAHTFALWYLTDVLGQGDGRIIVDRDLLAQGPYRAYLSGRWNGALAGAADAAEWISMNGRNRPMTVVHADGRIEPWTDGASNAKGP